MAMDVASGKVSAMIQITDNCLLECLPTTFYIPLLIQTFSTAVANAAISAIQYFYDSLVELPLDEKVPTFFSHQLITRATVDTVALPNLIRQRKNETILLSVIDAVQQRPDMLTDFCDILDSMYIAKELSQQIKGNLLHLTLRHLKPGAPEDPVLLYAHYHAQLQRAVITSMHYLCSIVNVGI